jgi:rod shape-determining protein MreC
MLSWKKILTAITTISFLVFLSTRLFFFKKSFLENSASVLLYPILVVSGVVADYVHNLTKKNLSYKELQQSYCGLENKYNELLERYSKLFMTIRYDKMSSELREFQRRYDLSSSILSRILVKNFSDEGHYFIINRGARDKVEKDMIAIYKLQVVGRVVDVFNFYSKVQCITDKNSKIASFLNTTNTEGITVGTNIINCCNLSYVNNLSTVADEDLVFSSGQGTIFPEGFCLGKILNHKLKDKALYHEIEVKPLIDLTSLRFCLLTDQSKITLF